LLVFEENFRDVDEVSGEFDADLERIVTYSSVRSVVRGMNRDPFTALKLGCFVSRFAVDCE
jgi:hypothetical protein